MESTVVPWDTGLNDVFKTIAGSNDSPFCVQAGPGTGKSFGLQRRIIRLLQEGINPQRIFACTFTNVAALDLRKKIEEIGLPQVASIRVGTLHSYCFEVLLRNKLLIPTGRTPRPFLDYEVEFLLEDLKGGSFGDKKATELLLEGFISAWALEQDQVPGWPTDPIKKQFENELYGWLKYYDCMLIGEVIPKTLQFFNNNPAAPELTAFDHILIDEYQDLNKAEQSVIDKISQNGKLFVVGDADQSIYGFKNAHPEGIIEFGLYHKGAHQEELSECRRCPKKVVRMANRLIVKNRKRASQPLTEYSNNVDGTVVGIQWNDQNEEAKGIARIVHSYLFKKQFPIGEILILVPNKHIGKVVYEALSNLDIKVKNYAVNPILKNNPAKPILSRPLYSCSLLRLLANPSDRVSLRCCIGFSVPELLRNTWKDIRSSANSHSAPISNILNEILDGKFPVRQSKKVKEKILKLNQDIARLSLLSPKEVIDDLFPSTEPWSHVFRESMSVLDLDSSSLADCLSAIIDNLAKIDPPSNLDCVRLMTLHKSKGLTARLTIITSVSNGFIPTEPSKKIEDQTAKLKELEEKRRVFYVGLTRTTDILIISNFLNSNLRLSRQSGITQASRSSYQTLHTPTSDFITELEETAPQFILGNEFLKSL